MLERILRIPLPSGTLTLFDPEVMAHRRTSEPGWGQDPAALRAEADALRLLSIAPGAARVEVRMAEEDAVAPPPSARSAAVRIQSGKLFLADASELPSTQWGKRPRWNLWDWLWAVFVVALVPFTWWLVKVFSGLTLGVLGGTWVAFVLSCIPMSWMVFRYGHDFNRYSGVPPKDHPERVLDLPAGDYVVAWEQRGSGELPIVQLWFGVQSTAPLSSADDERRLRPA